MNFKLRSGVIFFAATLSLMIAQTGFGQQSKPGEPARKVESAGQKSSNEKPANRDVPPSEESKNAKLNGDKQAVQAKADDGLTTVPDAAVATSIKDQPVTVKPPKASVKTKNFAITFNDLKFKMEKTEKFSRSMLNDQINEYHGSKVKIRGYIRPNLKQTGMSKFIFVRDNKECCFGPQAAIFDNILVRLQKDRSVNYTVRPVTVQGRFVLKEYNGPDGNVWSLYRMYDAKIVR